jgi:pilus assembly protein CpaE
MHDCVVVDGPSRFDPGARAVLDIADEILLVIHLLVPCVRNASRMIDGMRQIGFNLNRVKLICNRFGQVSASLSLDDVRQALNLDVFAVLPDDWASMSGSINLGEPLVTHAPKSKIRLAYSELAGRLVQPEALEHAVATGKKGGLLSKLF